MTFLTAAYLAATPLPVISLGFIIGIKLGTEGSTMILVPA